MDKLLELPEINELEDIKLALHKSLANLPNFSQCALLDYPSHYNIGDHLIWLGTIFYLIDVLKVKINYLASITDFSESELEKKASDCPILLHGGGNLGDLWPNYQKFREKIIRQYQDRPIVIMPQSLYFQNADNLQHTANIFNKHPDLTIFIRDKYSYKIAQEHFNNCRVILAPDMAFQMVNMPGILFQRKPQNPALYLYRQDKESNNKFSADALGISDLIVQDWVAFEWINKLPPNFPYIPGLVKLIREGWQRGLSTPQEWFERQKWEKLHQNARKLSKIYRPNLHQKSWSLMHSGIYQLQQYHLVITNRLHVHILCLLLNIPHIVLPGSYYKIEAFYQTWTKHLPLAKFIKEPAQVKIAVKEILSSASKSKKS